MPKRLSRVYLSWGRGKGEGGILELRQSMLQLAFYNLTLRAEPRTLEVEGEDIRAHVRRARGNTMVYLLYSQLKPLPLGETVEPRGEHVPPGYRIWVTKLPIGTYLTVSLPEGWSYDYIVLSSDRSCILSRGGRRAYVEEGPSTVSVYFV